LQEGGGGGGAGGAPLGGLRRKTRAPSPSLSSAGKGRGERGLKGRKAVSRIKAEKKGDKSNRDRRGGARQGRVRTRQGGGRRKGGYLHLFTNLQGERKKRLYATVCPREKRTKSSRKKDRGIASSSQKKGERQREKAVSHTCKLILRAEGEKRKEDPKGMGGKKEREKKQP